MSKPISQPVVPVQPNQQYYGTQELSLFKTFSRDTYLATFGVQAPAYDPSRLIKSWFDSTVDLSDPGNVVVYKILGQDQNGNWTLKQTVMPTVEAATVNLPGTISFPTYVVSPTQATRGNSTINALFLSLDSEAQALMTEIGASSVIDEGNTAVFPVVYPPNEPRRTWDVVFQGQPLNVGMLLNNKYAKGIGAPGHWDTSHGDAVWVPDPPA